MREIDNEELKEKSESLIALLESERKDGVLDEIAGIDDEGVRLEIYQGAIKGSNRRIEQLEEAIDQARIEYDRKLEELRRQLDEEKDWKEKITQAKDEFISEIEVKKKKVITIEEEEVTLEDYDEEGYNSKGYNAEGFDRKGFDAKGIHKETGTQYGPDGFNKYGHNSEDYDREGYDLMGYDKQGYDREGYNPWGYNRDGFDKNGKYDPVFDRTDLKTERIEVIQKTREDEENKKKDGATREGKIKQILELKSRKESIEDLINEEKKLAEKIFGKNNKEEK